MSYTTKRTNKKIIQSTSSFTEIAEKINLVDVIIKGIELIKSLNTLIQQSLCHHSNPNNTVGVDVSGDIENNI